nr:serine hydrolase [Mucilaginibacter sp. L294]
MKINYLKSSLLVFSVSLITNVSLAQTQQTKDSIDNFIAGKMQKLQIPGLQLAVIRNGKLEKLKSYGLANIENNVAATDESVFSINSCTKAFVGVAIMQLQEQGKLNINDPISKYIDNIPLSWQKITLKQLLTNTSGLPNIIDDTEHVLGGGREAAAWATVKALPIEFNPGDKFSYNQTGYVILGKIITKLSGMHFTEFIEENQFKVVGMMQTRFGDSNDIIPHSAGGYSVVNSVNGQWAEGKDLRAIYMEFPVFFRTASGILSTAKELAEWIIALQSGKLLRNKASLTALWSPAILNNGQVGGFNNLVNGYALGWPTATRADHPAVGPVGGMRSTFFVYPQDDLSIIVLTNLQGANPEYFTDEIAGYYIPDMHEANGFGLPHYVKQLRQELLKSGFDNAFTISKNLKKKDPKFTLNENDLNGYGYRLLGEEKRKEALAIFKLNTELFPKSGNTYDSYAETLLLLGEKDAALKNYKLSFKLDPKNTNAANQIKNLERK